MVLRCGRRLCWLVVLTIMGCHHDLDDRPADTAGDAMATDSGVPDLPAGDRAAPDRAIPGKAIPNKAMPDKAIPDLLQPDLLQPDLSQPDLLQPDLLQPDLIPPDMWVCGSKLIEGTEQCDGAVPAGKTCVTEGFTSGTLACDNKTCKLDTSGCKKI